MTLHSPASTAPDRGAAPKRERRTCERYDLSLTGRFLINGTDVRDLKTMNISSGGAFILSPAPPPSGQTIVCYLDALGRVTADVVRRDWRGFALRFHVTPLKRDKLAGRLSWLTSDAGEPRPESRNAERISQSGQAIVILKDGTQLQCNVTDMSILGAAFEALGAPPFVGERVQAANFAAEVVRVQGRKFAVRFLYSVEGITG